MNTDNPQIISIMKPDINTKDIPVYLEGGLKLGRNGRPVTFRQFVLTHWTKSPEYVMNDDGLVVTAALPRSWFHLFRPPRRYSWKFSALVPGKTTKYLCQ